MKNKLLASSVALPHLSAGGLCDSRHERPRDRCQLEARLQGTKQDGTFATSKLAPGNYIVHFVSKQDMTKKPINTC